MHNIRSAWVSEPLNQRAPYHHPHLLTFLSNLVLHVSSSGSYVFWLCAILLPSHPSTYSGQVIVGEGQASFCHFDHFNS